MQKQMKRTVFDYRMPLHPKKQILTQGESKTNNLANIDILSLLQYLRKGSIYLRLNVLCPKYSLTEMLRRYMKGTREFLTS